MAVAYDNSIGATDYGVTSITTGNFTISGSDRAAFLALGTYVAVSAISMTCGTQSGSAVSGAAASNGTYRVNGFAVINPSTGTRNASASWTTAATGLLTAITATGVDQTTPCVNGGADNGGYQASIDLAVTSATGDMTTTAILSDNEAYTTSQTVRTDAGGTTVFKADTAAGAASVTHTWTGSISTVLMVGANFKAVAAQLGFPFPRYPMAHLLVR